MPFEFQQYLQNLAVLRAVGRALHLDEIVEIGEIGRHLANVFSHLVFPDLLEGHAQYIRMNVYIQNVLPETVSSLTS